MSLEYQQLYSKKRRDKYELDNNAKVHKKFTVRFVDTHSKSYLHA